MGKKKRKEDTNILDILAAVEEGRSSMNDLIDFTEANCKKKKKDKIGKNGLPKKWSNVIESNIHDEYYEEDDDDFEGFGDAPSYHKAMQVDRKIDKVVRTEPVRGGAHKKPAGAPKKKELRKIHFSILDDLERLIVWDGIIPESAFLHGHTYLDNYTEDYSDEELSQYGLFCIQYGCMMRHPAAIFTEDEFKEVIKGVQEFDSGRFMFVVHGQYIMAYAFDDSFDDAAAALGYGVAEQGAAGIFTLNAVSFAAACDTVDSEFFYDDPNYIEFFRKKYNMANEFIEEFRGHESTVITDDPNKYEWSGFIFDEFSKNMELFIADVTGTSNIEVDIEDDFDEEPDDDTDGIDETDVDEYQKFQNQTIQAHDIVEELENDEEEDDEEDEEEDDLESELGEEEVYVYLGNENAEEINDEVSDDDLLPENSGASIETVQPDDAVVEEAKTITPIRKNHR